MYIVQLVDGMVMFSVILLIGTGWSFLKPYLHPREKRLLMIVLPMQASCVRVLLACILSCGTCGYFTLTARCPGGR
jgi:hypothetical protein